MLASGHNGVKSIISYFKGDRNFSRLMIGVDRPDSKEPAIVRKWVLGTFS